MINREFYCVELAFSDNPAQDWGRIIEPILNLATDFEFQIQQNMEDKLDFDSISIQYDTLVFLPKYSSIFETLNIVRIEKCDQVILRINQITSLHEWLFLKYSYLSIFNNELLLLYSDPRENNIFINSQNCNSSVLSILRKMKTSVVVFGEQGIEYKEELAKG